MTSHTYFLEGLCPPFWKVGGALAPLAPPLPPPLSWLTSFCRGVCFKKVTDWVSEITLLSEIAQTHPHSAYCALTHDLIGRWTYVMRTIPDIALLLVPFEDAIRLHLIPALTGFDACSPILRDLLALPCHLGGMGIANPIDIADSQFDASVKVTAPLKELIMDQSLTASPPDVRRYQS